MIQQFCLICIVKDKTYWKIDNVKKNKNTAYLVYHVAEHKWLVCIRLWFVMVIE